MMRSSKGSVTLTPEEERQFAPFHRLDAFACGYFDIEAGRWLGGNSYTGLAAQAWDRGAQLFMNRRRARQGG